MDLIDQIEKHRFLGSEALVWLWFESELNEGRLEVPGVGPAEVYLEGQLTLTFDKEQSKLKGQAPSASPEAREALRQGKLPTNAKLRVARGELEYSFTFTAGTLALSAVKIPAIVKEKDDVDEQFYERMYLVEELEALFTALYARFLALRLSPAWESEVVPAIRSWVHDKPVDLTAYQRVTAKVPALKGQKRPHSSPPASERVERGAPVKLRAVG